MRARFLRAALLSASSLAVVIVAGPARAQVIDVEWEGTSSDDWFDATNWDGGTIPLSTENIGIDSVTPYPTAIDGASAVTRNLFVGFSDTGELSIINAGTLASRASGLGLDPGSQGTVTVSGAGSQWVNSDVLVVGADGRGLLSIEDQGLVTSTGGSIGLVDGTGTVTIDGAGSRWSISGDLFVGDGASFSGGNEVGSGSLSITDGGRLESGETRIGNGPNAEGSVIVDGPSSLWTNSAGMLVGFSGTGALTVSNGGQVTTADASGLGVEEGSRGTVVLEGASQWTAGSIVFVGSEGDGDLTITSGASLDAPVVLIGQFATSQSAVEVNGGGSALNAASGIIVGYRGKGELSILNNTTVVSGIGEIANLAGSEGHVSLGGGASWTNANDITVATEGYGRLSIDSGAVVSSLRGIIAEAEGSVGTVEIDGASSAWTNSSDFFVGVAGEGTLSLSEGAQLGNVHGYVGADTTGTGTATVTDGASWSNTGNLLVGDSGTGMLTISDGGSVDNVEAFVGTFNGAEGTVVVTGTGSTWTSTANLVVGDAGTGTLFIEDGGDVSAPNISIGLSSDGTGVATVRDSGSMLTVGGQLTVGDGGDGSLTLANGGVVTSDNSVIGLNANSTGTARVVGSGSTWTNTGLVFYVGAFGAGTLTVEDSGTVSSGASVIGFAPGAGSTATVTGAGSSWKSAGPLFVGGGGEGTLTIADGGAVSNAFFGSIGEQPFSTGAVTVTGPGSTWKNAGDLYVGRQGEGTLTIAHGGVVTSEFGLIASNNLNATGTVTVSGSGSAWENSRDLIVGWVGEGALTIENGGRVSNVDGSIGVSGTVGTVLATGPDSTWANSGQLLVGGLGVGTLAITDGATVSSNTAVVGANAGSQGKVRVTGSGSTWTNTGDLRIGNHGEGVLTISDNAAVSTQSFAAIASHVGSQGTINIGAAEGDAAATAGVLDTPELQFGAGDGQLVFNHTETGYQFAPNLVGSGRINILAGTTEINNAAGFLGATTVNDAAILVANGTLGGTLDVVAGGRLQGDGSVGTTTIAGTIAPGNSIGTLMVAGSYTQAAGSTYELEVDSTGDADRIDVTGTATLSGGAVEVVPLPDFAVDSPYTVLSATGGLGGTFDDISFDTGSSLFLSPDLTYDADNAYLTIQQVANFDSVADTPNQAAAAQGVQSLGGGNAIFSAVALLGSADEARDAFDALSGEVHASARGMFVEDSRFAREAALNRVRAAFGSVAAESSAVVLAYGPEGREISPPHTERFAAWGQTFGSWGRWDGDGNAATLDRDTGGFFLGADMTVANTWKLGILTGYSRTSFDIDDRASKGDSNNLHLGLYGGTQTGAVGLRGGLAYTWHDIETSRDVAFGDFAERLNADYDAGTFQVFGEAGYRIDTTTVALEPFASLAHVQARSDDFSETGGAAALTVENRTTNITLTALGLRASREFDLASGSLATSGMIGWQHAFGDTAPGSTHTLAGGDAFAITGVPIAEDAAILDVGLDYSFSGNTTVGISYEGQFASDAHDHGFNAWLSARF